MRVVYDTAKGVWKALGRDVPSIEAPHVDGDYYYFVQRRGWLLRFFGGWIAGDANLGQILALDGRHMTDLPPFLPTSYRGRLQDYKSQIGWIGEVDGDTLVVTMYCPDPGDFRMVLDLRGPDFDFLSFDVR